MSRKIRHLISLSKVVSAVFNPFYFTFVAFVLLLTCTYLRILPLFYKVYILSVIFFFTILLPMLGIFLYGKIMKHPKGYLRKRENRLTPYAITLLSYLFGYLSMQKLFIPHYMGSIVVSVLLSMLVCSMINTRWKISAHMTMCGVMTGVLFGWGFLSYANILPLLAAVIFIAGLLGTARMILREHTISQIFAGYINGIICSIIGIIYI